MIAISHEMVRHILLANGLKTVDQATMMSFTQADAEFVYHMENVLSVYTRPYDAIRRQVCMDEINTQLDTSIKL